MSEQQSNNDSAPGTFSFFETFQSSGAEIPSLESIAVSGELPQLPSSVPEVKQTSDPAEADPVAEIQHPESLEVAADVPDQTQSQASGGAVAEVDLGASVADMKDDEDDFDSEIDPVLRPPAAPPTPRESVPPTSVSAEQSTEQSSALHVPEPTVNSADPQPQHEEVVSEVGSDKTAGASPKPLTVEEIVAAAAARVNPPAQDQAKSTPAAPPVSETFSQPIVETQPVVSEPVPAVSKPVAQAPQVAPSTEVATEAPAAKPVAVESIVDQVISGQSVVVPPTNGDPAVGGSTENAVQKNQVEDVRKSQVTEVASQKSVAEPVSKAASVSDSSSGSSEISQDGKPRFADLPLSDFVKSAVQQSGYDTPTDIQAQIIPHMLEGRDVVAQSQTGTGKTAAFALPVLSRIETSRRETQVLVLAPTRELAMQVAESFETYGADVPGFQVAAIYGGAGYDHQIRQLKRASVVVGTPGRVIDHIKKGTLKLSTLSCLVLDEADEMLNMGFLEDVQFVLEHTPENRQVALFSATMPGPIRNIADRYLNNPVKITVKQKTMTAEAIRQRAVFVPPRDKMEVLARFLEVEETDGVIVFARTREGTATVADELNARGLKAAALNGDMPQQVRERTVDQLKAGRLNIVVATDVAARGLDVPRILHVFNYDVPMDNESYIHRIGRTGRAGKEGHAILFVTGGQKNRLRSIERATRQPIEIVEAPTADQVNDVRKKTFLASIDQTIGKRDLSFFKQMLSDHAAATGVELIDIAAALADQLQQGRPFFAEDLPKTRRREHDRNRERNEHGGGRDRFERGDRGGRQDRRRTGGPARGGMQRYRIEVGRADNVKPGNIVGAVANEGGIDGDQIGPISIYDDYSTVDLPDGMPQDVFQTLRKVRVAGKQLQLSRATPSDDQPKSRFGGKKFGDRKGGGASGGPGGNRRFGGQGGGGNKGKSFGKRKFRRD